MSKVISKEESRCIRINNWIFEVKMVRAMRVAEYGQPYSAIANVNFNGDNVYIDGLMTDSATELSREDFKSLKAYFQRLGVKEIQFDRYKNQQWIQRSLNVAPLAEEPVVLKLVATG